VRYGTDGQGLGNWGGPAPESWISGPGGWIPETRSNVS